MPVFPGAPPGEKSQNALVGGRKEANFLRVLTLETQTLARACGKSHVHNLEPEDLVALTIEASLMARLRSPARLSVCRDVSYPAETNERLPELLRNRRTKSLSDSAIISVESASPR